MQVTGPRPWRGTPIQGCRASYRYGASPPLARWLSPTSIAVPRCPIRAPSPLPVPRVPLPTRPPRARRQVARPTRSTLTSRAYASASSSTCALPGQLRGVGLRCCWRCSGRFPSWWRPWPLQRRGPGRKLQPEQDRPQTRLQLSSGLYTQEPFSFSFTSFEISCTVEVLSLLKGFTNPPQRYLILFIKEEGGLDIIPCPFEKRRLTRTNPLAANTITYRNEGNIFSAIPKINQ